MSRSGGLLGDIADATALLGAEGGGPLAAMASWRQAGSRVCVTIRSTGKGRDALRYGRRILRILPCAIDTLGTARGVSVSLALRVVWDLVLQRPPDRYAVII